MRINIREELWYIELLHIFERKNRNLEVVGKRGWGGLRADFSKPQVDASVIDSMCFFSAQADFGQGWASIKYSFLGRGDTSRTRWQPAAKASSALPLRGDPSSPPRLGAMCFHQSTVPFRLPNLPSPRKFLSGNPEKGSEKAKDPTSSLLPALANTFPLSPQLLRTRVQIWVPVSSLSPPPPHPRLNHVFGTSSDWIFRAE